MKTLALEPKLGLPNRVSGRPGSLSCDRKSCSVSVYLVALVNPEDFKVGLRNEFSVTLLEIDRDEEDFDKVFEGSADGDFGGQTDHHPCCARLDAIDSNGDISVIEVGVFNDDQGTRNPEDGDPWMSESILDELVQFSKLVDEYVIAPGLEPGSADARTAG